MEQLLNESQENMDYVLDKVFEILKEHNLTGVVAVSDGSQYVCKLVKLDATYSLIDYEGTTDNGDSIYTFDTREGTVGEFQQDAEATLNTLSGLAVGLSRTVEMLEGMQEKFTEFVQTVVKRVQFKTKLRNFSQNNPN